MAMSAFDSIPIPPLTEWREYHDDAKGIPYYHNKVSNKTQYGLPPEYAAWKTAALQSFLETTASGWKLLISESGMYQYFNEAQNVLQAEQPGEVPQFLHYIIELARSKKKVKPADIVIVQPKASELTVAESIPPVAMSTGPAFEEVSMSLADHVREDPVAKAELTAEEIKALEADELQALESLLGKRDGIMESSAVESIKRLRQLSSESPEVTIGRLSSSYVGYAQMTNIVAEWLVLAKSLKSQSTAGLVEEKETAAFTGSQFSYNQLHSVVETELTQEVANVLKVKFNKNSADSIMSRYEGNPPWLLEMMKDDVLRRALIELYDLHNNSTLLGYCIRKISEMGHHREIAQIVRESEYLSVFNNLLLDLLTRSSECAAENVRDLFDDLRKNCSSAEYLYIYVNDLFLNIENRLLDASSFQWASVDAVNVVRHRICRLRQELEGTVATLRQDAASKATGDESSLFALQIIRGGSQYLPPSQLQQLLQSKASDLSVAVSWQLYDIMKIGKATADHIRRIYLYYFRVPIVEDVKGSLTAEGFRSITASVSLLRQPTILRYFLDTLVDSAKYIPPSEQRKLSRLITMASICDDRDTVAAGFYDDAFFASSFAPIEDNVNSLPSLFREIYSSASGITSEDLRERLMRLIDTPILSMVVLHWVEFLSADKSLLTKSEYLTLHPTFLQVINHAATCHQLQIPDCYRLLTSIIQDVKSFSLVLEDEADGGPTSVSSLAMSMKTSELIAILLRDSIACLFCIMSTGFTTLPLTYLCDNINSWSSDLARYVVHQLVDGMRPPPYTVVFAEKAILFLSVESSLNSLKSLQQGHWDKLLRFAVDIKSTSGISSEVLTLLDRVNNECLRLKGLQSSTH